MSMINKTFFSIFLKQTAVFLVVHITLGLNLSNDIFFSLGRVTNYII